MTAVPRVHVLVPYSRFQECQDRRRRIAAELSHRTTLEDVAVLTNGEVAIVKAAVEEGIAPGGGVGTM
jgi:hypothetical protein